MKMENTRISEVLPSVKRLNKFKSVWLSLSELFDVHMFRGCIIESMEARTVYLVLVIIRYNEDEFFMLDQQFSYSYDNYTDVFSFKNLSRDIISRLSISLDKYGLDECDVLLVQILYREVFYDNL